MKTIKDFIAFGGLYQGHYMSIYQFCNLNEISTRIDSKSLTKSKCIFYQVTHDGYEID